MKALEISMTKSERLGKYDFKHDNYSEHGLGRVTEILKTMSHTNFSKHRGLKILG